MQRTFPDWFTGGYAEQYFQQYLLPLRGIPALRFLQIGAYAGDASRWLVDHILTGQGSVLVDVDTWQGSVGESAHDGIDFRDVQRFYDLHRPARTETFHGSSDEFFTTEPGLFDFVYIDGDHRPQQVLRDAVNAEQVLKPGGLLAFDDYLWSDPAVPRMLPRPAIDGFVRCYEDTFQVIGTGLQVWLRKTVEGALT